MSPPLMVLLGPSAVGKSAVVLELAREMDGEIISCDSMQIYRGMDIGTAKPSVEEQNMIPHHLIDTVEPEDTYNVARFLREIESAVDETMSREKLPLVVGGTPMYLKAFLFGIFEGPSADPSLRETLQREADERGIPALWERMKRIDPEAADRIHPNDLRRIVRALEVYEKTGTPISALQNQWLENNPARDAALIGLSRPRETLYRRVDERVDKMVELGLVDEVKGLRNRLGPTAGRALGYREITEYLDGKCTLEETVQAIKNNTHNFIRKQTTWYRSLKGVIWIDVKDNEPPAETAEKVLLENVGWIVRRD